MKSIAPSNVYIFSADAFSILCRTNLLKSFLSPQMYKEMNGSYVSCCSNTDILSHRNYSLPIFADKMRTSYSINKTETVQSKILTK